MFQVEDMGIRAFTSSERKAKQIQRQKLVNVAEISYADIMKLKPLLTAAGIECTYAENKRLPDSEKTSKPELNYHCFLQATPFWADFLFIELKNHSNIKSLNIIYKLPTSEPIPPATEKQSILKKITKSLF